MEKMVSQTKIMAWSKDCQNWNYQGLFSLNPSIHHSQVRAFSDGCKGISWQTFHDRPLDSMYEHTSDLIPDKQLRIYFDNPRKCINGETKFREKLPLKQQPVKVDYGENLSIDVIYIEHTLAAGLMFTLIAISLIIFALCWTMEKGDISGGFSVLAGLVALVTLGIGLCFRR